MRKCEDMVRSRDAKFSVSTDGTYVIFWIMLRVSDTLVHAYRSHTPHGTSLRLFRVGLLK